MVHDFSTLWKQWQRITVSGEWIAHTELVAALLDALLFPKIIVVCTCETHTYSKDSLSPASSRADVAAKTAAKQTVKPDHSINIKTTQTPSLNTNLQATMHIDTLFHPRGINDGMHAAPVWTTRLLNVLKSSACFVFFLINIEAVGVTFLIHATYGKHPDDSPTSQT